MRSSITPSRSVVAGIFMLGSAVLALLGPDAAAQLRSMVHWALAPLGDAGMYLTASVKRGTSPTPELTEAEVAEVAAENERLRAIVTTQREWLRRLNARVRGGEGTYKRIFSRAFGPDEDIPVRLVAARTVATDSLPYGWTRVLNAGANDGVEDDMLATQRLLLTDRSKQLPPNLAVLSGAALVGRVLETGAFTARLQLVTDRAFAMRCHVGRVIDPANPRQVQIRARMMPLTPRINYPVEAYVHGDGASGLVCDPIPAVHNIKPGDIIQTRGDEALLPAAVVIGRVSEVENDPEHPGMVIVHARPLADLASLRDVYICVPRIRRPADRGGS
jgi:cell shape-determining protein MreC